MSGLSCSARDLCCGMQDLSLWHTGSLVVAHGLSCPEACGILVPRPGIEPASPALEGGFLTTGPPGKSPGMRSWWRHTANILVPRELALILFQSRMKTIFFLMHSVNASEIPGWRNFKVKEFLDLSVKYPLVREASVRDALGSVLSRFWIKAGRKRKTYLWNSQMPNKI